MKIVDESIAPYQIWQEDNYYTVGIPKESWKDLKKTEKVVNLSNANYFTNLSNCILHIVKLKVSSLDEEKTLKSYIDRYEEIKSEILNKITI